MANVKTSRDLLQPKSRWLKWMVLLFCVILYGNTLNHQYALDDYSVILEHQHVQAGIDGIGKLMTTNYRHGQQGFNDGLYRPLSLVTFAIEQSWFKGNTFISHLLNILLYAFGGLFLFLSLQRIFSEQELLIPFSITLLFLAHPLHTEVAANIKSRDELLAFFGFALSLYSFIRSKENRRFLLLAIFAFVMALFSKESAVILALFIPTLMLLGKKYQIKDLQSIFFITIPLVIGFVLWRNHVIESMENSVDPGNFGLLNNPIAATEDPSLRWGSTLALQMIFLEKLLFPFSLIHDYSFNQIPLVNLLSPSSILGLVVYLILGACSVLAILKKNKWGYIAILYLLSIGIASQIALPIGIQFAERMLFLTVLPFAIALVFLVKKILLKKSTFLSLSKQKSLLFLLLGITALYAFKTINRNADWKNNLSLYSADIEKGSESARANYNFGTTLSEQADASSNAAQKQQYLQQAVTNLKQAVTIYPDYLDAWNNLGIVYKKMGNYQAAIQVYEQNIQRDPNYSKNYFNLGTAYYQLEEYRKAIIALEQYTQRVPNSADSYMLMAQAAGRINSFGEAVSLLNAYLQYRPNDANAFNMLGMAYGSLKQFLQAEKSFQKALQFEPNRTDVLLNMAVNYNRQSRTAEELRTLNNLLTIQPNHQAALRQMVFQLESQGRMEEASKYRSRLQ